MTDPATDGRIRTAAILVRDGVPSPDGIPLVLHQMRALAREGVRTLHILAGAAGGKLRATVAPEAERLGLDLHIAAEEGAPVAGGDTLIVDGDVLFDIDLGRLAAHVRARPAWLTVVAHPDDDPRAADILVQRDGWLERVLPAGRPRGTDWRNLAPAGLYVASPAVLAALPAGGAVDMVQDVVPALLGRGERVGVYSTPEYVRRIGSPASRAAAEADLRAGRPAAMHFSRRRPAVFFDCDGVLNQEPGSPGIVSPEQLDIIPGAAEAVRLVRAHGFLALAATNRSQVAKGLITEDELGHILGRLEAELAAGRGVLDRIYYCPHHPDAGAPGGVTALKIRCECRKPGNLLLRRAAEELPIDMTRSAIIGDTLRDIGAGRRSGIWAYGVRTGHGCLDGKAYPDDGSGLPVPDHMFDHVLDAARFQCSYRALARKALPDGLPARTGGGRPLVVAIGGRARAGKSILAHAIERSAREDGLDALRVEVDGRDAAAIQDASGRDVVLLDGTLAAHRDLAGRIDLRIFVDCVEPTLWARFSRLCHWKGLDRDAVDALWRAQRLEAWPAADAQRASADIVVTMETDP